MTLEQMKQRLSELQQQKVQIENHAKLMESQVHAVSGHIQELTFIINQLSQPAPECPQEELSEEEQLSAEMQVM